MQYMFIKNWCSTVLRVINDISIVLRPEEIYLLAFSEIFRYNGLGETHEQSWAFRNSRDQKPFWMMIQVTVESRLIHHR